MGSSSRCDPIMASTSTSSSSSVNWKYEVFLSFRGADLRKTFVDHLYAALDRCGIYAFKDDIRLQGGESISHQLLKAIERSRSAIVVFSSNYGSSGWCLDELEKIMECKEKLKFGLTVFPVFYDVDPSEVRRQSGTFGEGFAKAVERKADKADVWRKALQDAADLSGYNVRNTADGHESKCIKQIVDWILSNSCNIIASSDENLIGIESRVSNLISLIGRDLDDVRMIGIWGMGGSGKTTVARVAFDEVSKHFDGVSFIESVREVSQKSGLPFLQKKILLDILMEENQKVDSVSQGIQMIRRRLGHIMVLIVLDDVDDLEQLRALAGGHSWFGKGSRILITTRDEHLLKVHEVDEIHGVNLLTEDEAIQLFRRYAFKKCSPTEGYDKLSLNVARYAAGLPLTLKVLGSFLCGRGMAEWTSALERLKRFPEKKTLEILKISFDSLDDIEKDLFLDIACFFKGWKRDTVVRILDSCGFYPDIGISVLLQKCLITFSNEKFQMHDLIQEMGRKIVNQLHPKEPGKHSRLWHIEDISDVLEKNMGTEAIEAIVQADEYHDLVVQCDTKAFRSMKKLRILYLSTWGASSVRLDYLPNELQWLTWAGYPYKYLPGSFQALKLVGIEMQRSCIIQLWKEKKLLDKLKFLDLSWSMKLIRSPDFSGIPNLETLVLHHCTRLIEVHRSIGDLQRLVLLDLSYCENLVYFPSNIRLKSLEILKFSGCKKFTRFPELLGNMDILLRLYLGDTAIEDLPLSIANLTNLVLIDLRGCKNLLDLPDTICMLKYLTKMDLGGCRKLTKLPENLGHIESLEELLVDRTGVNLLPSSIVLLKNLKYVSFHGCMILEDSMGHIESNCLKVLDLSDCELSDQAIPVDIGKLSFLEKLKLSHNSFSFVPFIISQLSRLKMIDLSYCTQLKALPKLPSSIAILKANECTSLETIEGLSGMYEWLWMVSLQGCSSLMMYEKRWFDHCQQEYSITGRRSECLKSLRLPVGDSLLQSMLQGHALVNHRFSILYTQKDRAMHTPMWFGEEVKGNRFVLKLPPNWQNKITRFAVCVVFYNTEWTYPGINLGISLSKVRRHVSGLDPKLARSFGDRDVWMGYISFNLLRRSTEGVMPRADWMDTATQLFLTFDSSDGETESCAARLVYMEDIVGPSSFTCSSGQQQEDPNFAAETTVPCFRDKRSGNGIRLTLDT